MTLHIYGQGGWHDDVFIAGEEEDLIVLRDLIDKAIKSKRAQVSTELFAKDGESYSVYMRTVTSSEAERLMLPYTDEYAQELPGPGLLSPVKLFPTGSFDYPDLA